MTEPEERSQDGQDQVLQTLQGEIAEQHAAAEAEQDPAVRERRRESVAIRAEVAEEEAEAITAEIGENKETALSLRVSESLSRALKQRAVAEGLPLSALVRRLLTRAVNESDQAVTTIEQVERIARAAARDEVQHLSETA